MCIMVSASFMGQEMQSGHLVFSPLFTLFLHTYVILVNEIDSARTVVAAATFLHLLFSGVYPTQHND